jgi:hypothetical protein
MSNKDVNPRTQADSNMFDDSYRSLLPESEDETHASLCGRDTLLIDLAVPTEAFRIALSDCGATVVDCIIAPRNRFQHFIKHVVIRQQIKTVSVVAKKVGNTSDHRAGIDHSIHNTDVANVQSCGIG